MRIISILLLMTASSLFAENNEHCKDVGGGVLTNFIDPTNTFGTATGDLAGAIGVTVLGQASGANSTIILHVHHHWVTGTGDTLSLDDAYATLFPISSVPGLYAMSYLDGVRMNGDGTGRYKGATGKITAWGAVDLNKLQLTLRYEGKVCFAS